jgi:hypothetical protein
MRNRRQDRKKRDEVGQRFTGFASSRFCRLPLFASGPGPRGPGLHARADRPWSGHRSAATAWPTARTGPTRTRPARLPRVDCLAYDERPARNLGSG